MFLENMPKKSGFTKRKRNGQGSNPSKKPRNAKTRIATTTKASTDCDQLQNNENANYNLIQWVS